MRVPRRGTQVFLMSFCISFIILGCLMLALVFLVRLFESDEEHTDDVLLPAQTTESEDLSMLVIGCDALSDAPSLIWQIDYDGTDGSLQVQIFSPALLAETEGHTDTLAGHYVYGSILQLRRAVGTITGAPADRYLRLERTGLEILCDQLGGLDADFTEDFTVNGETFFAGEQHLFGRKLATLLLAEDVSLQKEWAERLLNERQSHIASDMDSFFDTLFRYGETSLTRYDIALRETHFGQTTTERPIFFTVRGS